MVNEVSCREEREDLLHHQRVPVLGNKRSCCIGTVDVAMLLYFTKSTFIIYEKDETEKWDGARKESAKKRVWGWWQQQRKN